MHYSFNLYINKELLILLWGILINKVSYTEELALSLIYLGLFIIISIFYKKKYLKIIMYFIMYFIIFFIIKYSFIEIINNICIKQILHNLYNIQINFINLYSKFIINLGFYKEQLLNSKIYECQEKNSTIETKSFIIKEPKNNYYKNIVNNYIMNNYISFNNNSYYIKIFTKIFTKQLILNWENYIIGLQKWIYEFINYITPFYNFYSNYKLLINKNLVQTNIENLYYNNTVNLLLNSWNFNHKEMDFLEFLRKKADKPNLELIKFLKDYYEILNKMSFYVYKNVSTINIPLTMEQTKEELYDSTIDIDPFDDPFDYWNMNDLDYLIDIKLDKIDIDRLTELTFDKLDKLDELDKINMLTYNKLDKLYLEKLDILTSENFNAWKFENFEMEKFEMNKLRMNKLEKLKKLTNNDLIELEISAISNITMDKLKKLTIPKLAKLETLVYISFQHWNTTQEWGYIDIDNIDYQLSSIHTLYPDNRQDPSAWIKHIWNMITILKELMICKVHYRGDSNFYKINFILDMDDIFFKIDKGKYSYPNNRTILPKDTLGMETTIYETVAPLPLINYILDMEASCMKRSSLSGQDLKFGHKYDIEINNWSTADTYESIQYTKWKIRTNTNPIDKDKLNKFLFIRKDPYRYQYNNINSIFIGESPMKWWKMVPIKPNRFTLVEKPIYVGGDLKKSIKGIKNFFKKGNYDLAWLKKYSTKREITRINWYAKNKKIWVYQTNWWNNLVNDILTLDVTLKRFFIKVYHRFSITRLMGKPTMEDYYKSKKSGILKIIESKIKPYEGLSKEEIRQKEEEYHLKLVARGYEWDEAKKWKTRELKMKLARKEYEKEKEILKIKVAWYKKHPWVLKRAKYMRRFLEEYNNPDKINYAKFKDELKNTIQASGEIAKQHIIWKKLYPKETNQLLFENKTTLKLWADSAYRAELEYKALRNLLPPVYFRNIYIDWSSLIAEKGIQTIFFENAPPRRYQEFFKYFNRRIWWYNPLKLNFHSDRPAQVKHNMIKFHDLTNYRHYTSEVCRNIIITFRDNFRLFLIKDYPLKYKLTEKPHSSWNLWVSRIYLWDIIKFHVIRPHQDFNPKYIQPDFFNPDFKENLDWKRAVLKINKELAQLAFQRTRRAYDIYQTMELTAREKLYWKVEQAELLARIKGFMVYKPGNTKEHWWKEVQENKKAIAWKYFKTWEYDLKAKKWEKLLPTTNDKTEKNMGLKVSKPETKAEKIMNTKYHHKKRINDLMIKRQLHKLNRKIVASKLVLEQYSGKDAVSFESVDNKKSMLRKVGTMPIKNNIKQIKEYFIKKNMNKIFLNGYNMYSKIYSDLNLAEAKDEFRIENRETFQEYEILSGKKRHYNIKRQNLDKYQHIHPLYLEMFFDGLKVEGKRHYDSMSVRGRNTKYTFFSLKVNHPAYINYSKIPMTRRVYEPIWQNCKIDPNLLFTKYVNIDHKAKKGKLDILRYSRENYKILVRNNEGPFEKFWKSKIKFRESNNWKTADFLDTYLKIFSDSKSYWNKAKKFATSNWLENFMKFIKSNEYAKKEQWYVANNFDNMRLEKLYRSIEFLSETVNLDIQYISYYGKIKGIKNIKEIGYKTNYIQDWSNVYEYEETPIKNYILYKIRKEELKVLHKIIYSIINYYNYNVLWFVKNTKESVYEVTKDLVRHFIINTKIKYIKYMVKYYKMYALQIKACYPYIITIICIFIYCVISAAIVILIKSYLPKNLIYGVGIKTKLERAKLDQVQEVIGSITSIDSEDVENLLNILRKKQIIIENESKKEVLKKETKKKKVNNMEIEYMTIEDIDMIKKHENMKKIISEDIEKLILEKSKGKFKLKKNFFDPEIRYIYSWDNRDDKSYYEPKKLGLKKLGLKNFEKVKVYHKFEERKKKDLKANYIIFYKKLIFEKNLEKWENNTKFRLENPVDWIKSINNIYLKLIKLVKNFRKDKKYNHNRMVFWEDPTLDEWNKVVYVYVFPKLLFNFFFIIKFIMGSLKLWNIGYWKKKWKQYVTYGVHVKINYKELKEHLEKEWTLEWFKSEADYGSGLYFKDMIKIVKEFEDIKKIALNPRIVKENKLRMERLGEILSLIEEEKKLKEMNQYLLDVEQIKLDRIENKYENKFADINNKLKLNVTKEDPKIWMEQKVKYKYIEEVYKKKLELEKEEIEFLKQTWTQRHKRHERDLQDTLQVLPMEDYKRLRAIMDHQVLILENDKSLRIKNFNDEIVDKGLDAKEARFYDLIPGYKEDLAEAYRVLEGKAKKNQTEEIISEKKVNTLYGALDKNYAYYRNWTTMGARMNYILSQILALFISWFENVKRIRKNEFNIQNIFKIIWIDLKNYIYKMYWEFMIIWKEHKALKNSGKNIKTILKFSILFTPIIIYSIILYIIFILFFFKYIIIWKSKKVIKNNIVKIKKTYNIMLKDSIKKILFKIFFYLKFILNILTLIFRDIETGHTLLEQLYYKLYHICGKFQRNIFFIKGAFILGYKNNKDVKEGLESVKKYLKLKFNVYKAKKKSLKQVLLNKKENIKIKIELILIIIDINTIIQNINKKILILIHKYIMYPIFRIDLKTFKLSYNEYLTISKESTIKLKENFKLLLLLKDLKTLDLIKLIIRNMFKLIIWPFTRLIKYQEIKYLANYKKGIQGFRDNPMYLILNIPKKKNDWRLKLHNIFMENKVSEYLKYLLLKETHLIEIFLKYKIAEVKWSDKNYYQDYFWRTWLWNWKKTKKKVLINLIAKSQNIEESYKNFEENIETKNWTIWERCKYAYYMYKVYKHVITEKDQQRISRDVFFYKLTKEKDKLIRMYFFKGLINWYTYITRNKVKYTKIKNIQPRLTEHKDYKYSIENIKATMHISTYIEEVPPQFWALVIIYNKYYKLLLKYVYTDPAYPIKWVSNTGLEFSKDYKWRLASPKHINHVPFFESKWIANDANTYSFEDMLISLANEPYDPLIRWLIFILEFGMSDEVLVDHDETWKNETECEKAVWGDISFSHLLTYNEYLDEYKYEIKEFNRLIGGIDFLKIAENSLEADRQKYYYDKYKVIKDRIVYQNENIIKNVLEKRKLKNAEILHKALLRNKKKTPKECELEIEDENLKEYFYVKKREFFEQNELEQYWDWQAQYDAKSVENTYFSADNLSIATFSAHDMETYNLYHKLSDNYSYLLDNIVLDSFDQTMEDIYTYLMTEVWKILQKTLKKDNVKSVINYKHLIIDESLLSRLNYTDHLVEREVDTIDIIYDKKGFKKVYEYKYPMLSFESLRVHSETGFIENNLIFMYFETGEIITYEDKVKFNEDAKAFQRNDKYHENSILLSLLTMLLKRKEQGRNVQRSNPFMKKSKEDLEIDSKFIQNVKWTLDQWLIFNNIDVENKLLNKNTVIFNERYHIWNLNRVPVRLKLPVKLKVDYEYGYSYYQDKKNFLKTHWPRTLLMGGTISPILKQSLKWEKAKRFLENHFDKKIRDIIIWMFTESALSQEALKVKKDYDYVFSNFIRNFNIFNKLYFVGLASYSWDLIRYHEIWFALDEFDYAGYFQLKQIEFLAHDPSILKIMTKVQDLFLDKYKPINYVYFFKNQFPGNYAYYTLKFMSIVSFIWWLKVIFYDQGTYLTNHYMFFWPILLFLILWYLTKKREDIHDTRKGAEIYLYRYHKSKVVSPLEWERNKLIIASRKKEWIANFYDQDKIPIIFSDGHSFLTNERPSGWWKGYSHLDKNNISYQYKHLKSLAFVVVNFVLWLYWSSYEFKFRNRWWIWAYYRYTEDSETLKLKKQYAPMSFYERHWFEDSWKRLEEGGNAYTRWYENTYRKYKQREPLELEIGYQDFQVERNLINKYKWAWEATISTNKTTNISIEIPGAKSDAYWTYLGNIINYHHYKKLDQFRRKSFADVVVLSRNQILKRRRLRKQKYFLRKKDRSITEHYFFDKVVKDDLRNFNDNLAYREVDALSFVKNDIKTNWSAFKSHLFRIQWNKRYTNRVNPYKKWFDFLDWAEYWYNYNVLDTRHLYLRFLIQSQGYTSQLILEDMKVYRGKKPIFVKHIEDIINYKAQNLLREKWIYASHKWSYKTGKELHMRTMLSITEKEKHYHNYCYHLIKYKLDRIIIMKEVYPEYFYKKYGDKQEQILLHKATAAERLEFLALEPDYLVYTLRKLGRYINNINRKIDKTVIIEYKCKKLLDYWAEQKNFWVLIKDVFDQTGLIDFLIILINLLIKIWGYFWVLINQTGLIDFLIILINLLIKIWV